MGARSPLDLRPSTSSQPNSPRPDVRARQLVPLLMPKARSRSAQAEKQVRSPFPNRSPIAHTLSPQDWKGGSACRERSHGLYGWGEAWETGRGGLGGLVSLSWE